MLKRSLVFGIAVVIAVSGISPALADHAKQASTGILNTPVWKVCRNGLEPGINATDTAMRLINATEVSASAVGCASGNQNVNVHAQEYLEPWLGATTCSGTYNSSNNRCSSKTVRLNARTIRATADPVKNWNTTACHELGHVGGLGHRPIDETCLSEADSPPAWTIYDSHDRGSLNLTYP